MIICSMVFFGIINAVGQALNINGDFIAIYDDGGLCIIEYVGNDVVAIIPTEVEAYGTIYPITKIGVDAFSGNTTLQAVYFPEKLREIADYAFRNCKNLWMLNDLPETLTRIGDHAFEGLQNLQTLILPNSELTIGDYAFAKCTNLTFILVPEKVKSFGDFAFYECMSINSLYGLGTTAPEFCNLTFANIDEGQRNLYYPEGYADAWAEYVYFRRFPRTAPAVCLNMISGGVYVNTKYLFSATAYGYLGATIESLEWESSNPDLATVDQDGIVTAIAPGNVSILCTATDSNGETATATCTLKVLSSTGVDAVTVAERLAEEYFTLQGLPAGSDRSALAPGIYIRRQGLEVTKIVVK